MLIQSSKVDRPVCFADIRAGGMTPLAANSLASLLRVNGDAFASTSLIFLCFPEESQSADPPSVLRSFKNAHFPQQTKRLPGRGGGLPLNHHLTPVA